MSAKQKVETALLAVIGDAALFTGARLRSQEERNTTRALPYVVAEYQSNGAWRTDKQGRHVGNERGHVTLTLWSSADTPDDAETSAEATHAADITRLRDSFQRSDLAALLSAAVADFTVVAIMPASPPAPEPRDQCLVESWAWEVRFLETDCS